MGYTVNFRTESKSYKEKKNIINPPEKWAVFENTQEAIIDPETWHLVQKLLATPRKKNELGETNPLTGLVFCADCGAKMYSKRVSEGISSTGKIRRAYESYDCSNNKMRALKTTPRCFNHHISTKALRELILYTIRDVSTFAINDKEAFTQKIYELSKINKDKSAKELKKKLNKGSRRLKELDLLYKKLYESYATGKIPEDKFEMLSSEYLTEQDELQKRISENKNVLNEYELSTDSIDQFLNLAQKYTNFSELTTPMINEFIEKIIVHAPDRSNGPRKQEVEIYFKFIGCFVPPEREPTPEELEQMRIKKYWQDRYWKRRDYELGRRKKKKDLAQQAKKEADTHKQKVADALAQVKQQAENGELLFMPTDKQIAI